MKLKYLSENYEKLLDTTIIVNGWIQTVRSQKDLSFIKLNDGSNAGGVQLIVDSNLEEKKR